MDNIIENVDFTQGREIHWHSKNKVEEKITRENIILNKDGTAENRWDIVSRPLFFDDQKPSGFCALTCTDKPELTLGQAFNPETYTPLSNAQFLELIFGTIGGTDHEIWSAGSVCGRTKIFTSVKLAGLDKFKAAGRDFEPFLNFGSGHGKAATLWINTSNICTVCDNTLTMNYLHTIQLAKDQDNDQIAIIRKHTKNLQITLPEISKLIDKAIGVQAEFQIALESLANIPCQQNKAEKIYTGFVSPPEAEKLSSRGRGIVDNLLSLFTRGKGNKGENMADLFSGVTDYYSHESAGENRWKQFVSSEFGAGANRKSEFWKACQPDKGEYSGLTKLESRGERILMTS